MALRISWLGDVAISRSRLERGAGVGSSAFGTARRIVPDRLLSALFLADFHLFDPTAEDGPYRIFIEPTRGTGVSVPRRLNIERLRRLMTEELREKAWERTASMGADSEAMAGNKGAKDRYEVQNRKMTEKLDEMKDESDEKYRWHDFLTANGLRRRAGGRLKRRCTL